MKVDRYGAGVFTLSDFLSQEECEQYISRAYELGYEEAEIQTFDGPAIFKDIRNNDRVIFDDVGLAKKLFERAKGCLPQIIYERSLKGFNERFRFYRYGPGQYFKWHKDGSYVRSENEESMLTFMIYLNEGYRGGITAFQWEKVQPKAGMALIFPHRLLHQGSEVEEGTKYVLRTDVMYSDNA